jgi:hypothetical protein
MSAIFCAPTKVGAPTLFSQEHRWSTVNMTGREALEHTITALHDMLIESPGFNRHFKAAADADRKVIRYDNHKLRTPQHFARLALEYDPPKNPWKEEISTEMLNGSGIYWRPNLLGRSRPTTEEEWKALSLFEAYKYLLRVQGNSTNNYAGQVDARAAHDALSRCMTTYSLWEDGEDAVMKATRVYAQLTLQLLKEEAERPAQRLSN